MTKILFFPAWYPNHTNPVAGQCVRQHAHVLTQENELAVYYTFGVIDLKGLVKFTEGREDGLLVYRSYYKRTPYKIMAPVNFSLYLIASIMGYLKVRKRFGVADINHVHVLTKTALVPFILKLADKTPYVITEHWSRYLPDRNSYKGFIRKLVTRLFVRYSSGISAVSPNLRDALIAHHLSKPNFPLIYNTIDAVKFSRKKAQGTSGVFNFLHVSGMQDRIKNVSGMIRACEFLKLRCLSFEFHFVGDSEEISNFKHQVEAKGLKAHVFFHGHVDEGLVDFFQNADALVIFSFFENQPMVIIESFFCGTPVIASKAGGMPAMISEENGLLVESNNSEDLANAMESMIKGKVKYDIELIRNLALEKYSDKAVERQLLNFYSTALDT